MSHRSVFKSAPSAPPSKSARELRIEKFDADKVTAFNSALKAPKNVDHPSLEIAPVSGPNAAESDETFLSNLERLPASAPVQRDDLADRALHLSDVPVRPIDPPVVSQFVRAVNRDFVPSFDLGNASTSLVVVVDEDPIECSSSTPTRQVREISLVSAQMPKIDIPPLAAPAPFSESSLVSAQMPKITLPISAPLSGLREVQQANLPPPLTSPRLTAASKKTLTSPKRLKVLKHLDGWSEIQGKLTPAGAAPVVSNDIRKFMSEIPLENRFQALSKISDVKLSEDKPRAAIPQHISKKLSHTRDKTPKRDVEEVRAIATSRAIVSDSPVSDSSSDDDTSFVTDDSDPSYKSSSSTSSGTRRERKKKNRLAAVTLARTQRALELHQAKQFGARLKALAASRGVHTVAERIDAFFHFHFRYSHLLCG